MRQELNAAQHDAVNTLNGPLLVLAGAGTGKTRVVTYRIANLIRHDVQPERILGVTFTNKAATEMRQRATQLLGRRRKAKPEISTFHSLCVRILRRHIPKLGYPERFAIYDRSDQESVARSALDEVRLPGATIRPSDLLFWVGFWKTRAMGPPEAAQQAETDREHLAASAYARYQAALKTAGAVDFDDLLLLTESLLRRFPKVRRGEAARFDHVLIDEYQDTNVSQYRIVRALTVSHRNLCVVGDDDQSIYGFRGAEVEHILRFKVDWPEAKVVCLEDNYRSRPEILKLANELIRFNRTRHEKELRAARRSGPQPRILQFQDENEEARAVVSDIRHVLENPRTQPRHLAILFRTKEQPRPLETELRRAGVPYVLVGGMSFYDRREVRDVLAYLKLMSHGDETSLRRIINRPARGISPKTVNLLGDFAARQRQSFWDVLPRAATVPGITRTAAERVREFRDVIETFQGNFSRKGGLVAATNRLIEAIGYRDEIRRQYADPVEQESRWQVIEQVINAMGSYERQVKKPTLQGFLDAVALDDRQDDDKDNKLQRNAVVLMTLHAAKGLEFPHVYLVGLEEGLLPHRKAVEEGDAAIDEERRLCYVGVTRAQDRLTISLALTRQKWGKPRDTLPSRFLYELTGQADHPNAKKARSGKLTPHRPVATTPAPRSGGRSKKKRRANL